LDDWQCDVIARDPMALLRGLIHSDGCRFENTGRAGWRYPRYSFFNLSADIRRVFEVAAGRLSVHTTRSGNHTLYVSRMKDVDFLDRFIGPKT
jgi:hypothetical protein